MAYRNLDEFLTRLEQAGEVIHEYIEPSQLKLPDLLPKQADKVQVYEDKVSGARIVANLFGTRQRVDWALRVESMQDLADRVSAMLELGKPHSFSALMSQGMKLFSALRTNTNQRAAQAYEAHSLSEWSDGLPMVLKHVHASGMTATLMTGETSLLMRPVNFGFTEDGLFMDSAPALAKGERVALVVGGDPAFMLAALTPLPDLVHRSFFASWLRERPLEVMRLPALDVDVLSNAEVVIVGKVRGGAPNGDNRFFDFDQHHLSLDIETVWTRGDAIYVLWSKREYDVLREALRTLFQPVIRKLLPSEMDIEQFLSHLKRVWLSDTSA